MNGCAGGWLAVLATEVKVAVGLDRYVWFPFGWSGLLGRVSGEDFGVKPLTSWPELSISMPSKSEGHSRERSRKRSLAGLI